MRLGETHPWWYQRGPSQSPSSKQNHVEVTRPSVRWGPQTGAVRPTDLITAILRVCWGPLLFLIIQAATQRWLRSQGTSSQTATKTQVFLHYFFRFSFISFLFFRSLFFFNFLFCLGSCLVSNFLFLSLFRLTIEAF